MNDRGRRYENYRSISPQAMGRQDSFGAFDGRRGGYDSRSRGYSPDGGERGDTYSGYSRGDSHDGARRDGYNRRGEYDRGSDYTRHSDYDRDAGYVRDAGYNRDSGYGRDVGYGRDAGYNRDAGYDQGFDYDSRDGDDYGENAAAAGEKNASKGIWTAAAALMICAAAVCFALIFDAEGMTLDTVMTSAKDMTSDIYTLSDSIRAGALNDSGLYQMERNKVIPWNEDPAPVPNYGDFSVTLGEKDNRASEWSYQDSTITVTGWTERIAGSKVYFSDIVIAHPSQLRTALANGKFPSSAYPSDMAKSVNAVLAANGDFTGYRESGMIIRQGVCYRSKIYDKVTWDVLLIDDKGDFHITDDRSINVEKFRNRVYTENGVDYNIVNTMHFGPSLVVNGKRKILHMSSGCGNQVNETYQRSHTAIGQLGPLHYLLCCVEETDNGMKPESFGVTIPVMADIMAEKQCVQAYNLDGGQSTTLVFGNNTLNFVNRGGERELSEIIYFASAENSE